MRGILIAEKDPEVRQQITVLFGDEGYRVLMASSVFEVLYLISTTRIQVVLLGIEFDRMAADELIPLLRKFKRDLTIILVSNEDSLPLLRKIRREGIFYHALTPLDADGTRELRMAVDCAFGQPLPRGFPEFSRELRT